MSTIIDINVTPSIQEVTINTVDNITVINVNTVGVGGSQTLQQTMELGRTYTQTIGDYTYTFGFDLLGNLFSLGVINNDNGNENFFTIQDNKIITRGANSVTGDEITQEYNIDDNRIITSTLGVNQVTQYIGGNVTNGYQLDTENASGINTFFIPNKTGTNSGASLFGVPNNKPAGEYDLLASDGNDLLLQANVNWKIGDYLNDQVSFIEGNVALETIYYRTNNNIFKGIILPDADNNYDIGSNSFRFKDAYFSGDVKVNGNSVLTQVDATPTDGSANAVSSNGVFDGLNKTRRLIIANSASSVTGTTAETIISSLLIPANSFDSLCDIWTTFTYNKSTATAIPIKLYYNTTNSLSGATQLALYTTGSFRNGMLNRKYLLNGTGLDLLASAPTTSLYNSELLDALFTASTVITIAPTSDIYFIYTVQNDAVGTTFNHKRSTVEKLKLN